MPQLNWNARTRATLATALIAAIVLSHSATAGADKKPGDESKIQQGYRINPVTLNLEGKNRAWVGLGSYIVNTGGCNDCHTHPSYLPGHNPFLGPARAHQRRAVPRGRPHVPAVTFCVR